MQNVEIDWRQLSWEEAQSVVGKMTDSLGCGIDQGIFEMVVALNLLDLHTFQSCEGHLDHGHPFPWVTLVNQEHSRRFTRTWQHVCSLEEAAKQVASEEAYDLYLVADLSLRLDLAQWKRDDHLFRRLTRLLDAFYADRDLPSSPTRLIVIRIHPGMCRIEPLFALHTKELPNHLKASYLRRGQVEMQAFTDYLKKQWQQGREKSHAS